MKIALTMLWTILTISTVFFLTTLMSKKSKMSREKTSAFECGFSPLSSPRKPFSTQFFLMGVLFLIFDSEISIILPMSTTKNIVMSEWFISSTFTMIFLILGLMNEWKNGILEWSN
nr:NADH dehydrogenase subunit 3 [Tettigometridae sp.]